MQLTVASACATARVDQEWFGHLDRDILALGCAAPGKRRARFIVPTVTNCRDVMATLVYAVQRPELPPLRMSDRFRHDVTYFMTAPGEHGVPRLPAGEYIVRLVEVRTWLDDGTLRVVSPLDSENRTEIELTEEQEAWLEWMFEHQVEHLRLQAAD